MFDANIVLQTIGNKASKKPVERKVWSIGLGTITSYLTMTNSAGITQIDSDAIGAPVRLVRNEDGTAKLNKKGRLTTKVAKPITEIVTQMRQSYEIGLQAQVAEYRKDHDAEYQATLNACIKSGAPIVKNDNAEINAYNESAKKAIAEAEALAKTQAEAEALAIINASKELVTA